MHSLSCGNLDLDFRKAVHRKQPRDAALYLQREDYLRSSKGELPRAPQTTHPKYKSAEPASPPRSIRSLLETDA